MPPTPAANIDPVGPGPFFHDKGHKVVMGSPLAGGGHSWKCKTCGLDYDPDEVKMEHELPENAPRPPPQSSETDLGVRMVEQNKASLKWRTSGGRIAGAADDAESQFRVRPQAVPAGLWSVHGTIDEDHPGIWAAPNGNAPDEPNILLADKLVGTSKRHKDVEPLNVVDLYRSYKVTPHAPTSTFLKYLVHRINHAQEYEDPETGHKLDLDFKMLVSKGKAAEKNGHVSLSDLHQWVHQHAPRVVPQLVYARDRLHSQIQRGVGLNVRSINGQPHVALTRGLDSDTVRDEHPLSSHADLPDTGFGTHMHHTWVPLKDLWYSYDLGTDAAYGSYGPEHEWLVSNTLPRYEAQPYDVRKANADGDSGVPAIFDDMSDSDLVKVVQAADPHYKMRALRSVAKHPQAGPEVAKLAWEMAGDGATDLMEYPWYPRPGVYGGLLDPTKSPNAHAVANPRNSPQEMEQAAKRIFVPDNRIGLDPFQDHRDAWLKHPAVNSQMVQRVWETTPQGKASNDLLASPLATPKMLDDAIQRYETGKDLTDDLIVSAVAKNPHVTEEQARRLFDAGERRGTLTGSFGYLPLPIDVLRKVKDEHDELTKKRSANASAFTDPTMNRRVAQVDGILSSHFNRHPGADKALVQLGAEGRLLPMHLLGRLWHQESLSPAAQQTLVGLLEKHKHEEYSGEWLDNLARSKKLTQDTVNYLAHHPHRGVRDTLFHNGSVTPEQIREAFPKDQPFPEPNGYALGVVASDIASNYWRRKQHEEKRTREHLVRPLPANLAKSEDDFWRAHARDWLAQHQTKGFYHFTTKDQADSIIREGGIEPQFTDELLHGLAVFARRASPEALKTWSRTAGPNDVALYFESPVEPEQHEDGSSYWTNRVPVENARIADVAPGEAPLEKMHGPLLFPRLGIGDDRRETKLVTTPGQRKTVLRAAANQSFRENYVGSGPKPTGRAKKSFIGDMATNYGATGAHATTWTGVAGEGHPGHGLKAADRAGIPNEGTGASSMSAAFAPSSVKKPHPAAVAMAQDPAALNAGATHEDMHRIFSRVQRQYGSKARSLLASNLMEAIPKDLRKPIYDHLNWRDPRWAKGGGYGNMDEEALTELGSYLNIAWQRDQYHRIQQHSPEQRQAFHDQMKRAHRMLTAIAPTVTDRWLQRERPWLTKGEARVPFTEPQGQAGLSAAAAHEVYQGSLKLQKNFPDLVNPNDFAFEFEVNPVLYAAVAERGDEVKLRKMAVIHDDPANPRSVWRVQNAAGEGPYQASWRAQGTDEEGALLSGRMLNNVSAKGPRPAPVYDFTPEEYETMNPTFGRGISDQVRFGFESPEHAASWFGPGVMKRLAAGGFNLVPVPAQKVWRSKSGKQVFFLPHVQHQAVGGMRKSEADFSIPLPGEEVFKPGEESAAKAFLGYRKEEARAMAAARFLTGRKVEPDEDAFRLALRIFDGDALRAALYSVGLADSEKHLRAIHAALDLGEFTPGELTKNEPGTPAIETVEPGAVDATDTAAEVGRAVTSGLVKPIKLGGKHSAGTMAARDPKTGDLWLLKPGSGKQSPALGARDDSSTQSAREAAFWHCAKRVGLGNYYPRADLLLVNGSQVAAMKLLGTTWKSLDERNRQVDGYAREVLTPYLLRGDVHRLATLDWVLGNPDSHGQNVMVHAESIALIDHGSAFAGPNFAPGRDAKSFTPYYLRVFAPPGYAKKLPEERVQGLPVLDQVADDAFRKWVQGIDAATLTETMSGHGIGDVAQRAVVKRLDDLQRYDGPKLSAYLDSLWAGLDAA